MCNRHNSTGFTLIEALLASGILAASIGAITCPFIAAAQNEQEDARRTVAIHLVQELMEEIIDRPFDDPDGGVAPGPDFGEYAIDEFDNIDDFDGYTDAGIYADDIWEPLAADEPAAAGLTRHVTTAYVYVSGQDTSQSPTFIRVIVEVKHAGEPIVKLSRLVYAQ